MVYKEGEPSRIKACFRELKKLCQRLFKLLSKEEYGLMTQINRIKYLAKAKLLMVAADN